MTEWITVREAWELYAAPITLDTFRRKLCGPDGILAERFALRVPLGKNRRSLMVSRTEIVALIQEERGLGG